MPGQKLADRARDRATGCRAASPHCFSSLVWPGSSCFGWRLLLLRSLFGLQAQLHSEALGGPTGTFQPLLIWMGPRTLTPPSAQLIITRLSVCTRNALCSLFFFNLWKWEDLPHCALCLSPRSVLPTSWEHFLLVTTVPLLHLIQGYENLLTEQLYFHLQALEHHLSCVTGALVRLIYNTLEKWNKDVNHQVSNKHFFHNKW